MLMWVAICVFCVCARWVLCILCLLHVLYVCCIAELVFFQVYTEYKLENSMYLNLTFHMYFLSFIFFLH